MLSKLWRMILDVRGALESLLLLLLMPVFGACLPWVIILWLLLLPPPRRKHETQNQPSPMEDSDVDG